MRVLLVYPNLYGMNMLPPAIGILNACLRREGHKVALFDTTIYPELGEGFDSDKQKDVRLNARPYDDTLLKSHAKLTSPTDDFKDYIQSFSPDLIAFSLTEDMYPNALTLLKALEEKDRPPVVAGGVFPSFAPELALRRSEGRIDYVLIGEGEKSLLELCRRLESGQDVSPIEGIWFLRKDGALRSSPLPKLIDVNTVPLPDYDFFPESRYYRPMQGRLWRMFPIETHRGCPYTCAYCNSPSQAKVYSLAQQRFFRKRKMERVREEISHCLDRYKADSFYFWADTFLAWSDREFDEFCEMYAEFALPFWIQTRPETVTEYKFHRLKEVGLLRVAFGVEHGNPEFREKTLSRKIDNDTIVNNLNILYNLGIPFSVNNIMGFPRETKELAFDTIELNRSIKSDGMNAYAFTPFHGVPLRRLAESLGYIKPEEISRSIMKPTMLRMPQWSREDIEGLRRCFVLYVKLPKSRWHEVAHAEQQTPEGNRVWEELRNEVLENYMEWGDRDEQDDPGAIDLDDDGVVDTDDLRKSVATISETDDDVC